jgi:hypothetical protein
MVVAACLPIGIAVAFKLIVVHGHGAAGLQHQLGASCAGFVAGGFGDGLVVRFKSEVGGRLLGFGGG